MATLFCNIGWMNNYDGIQGDSIKRGGAYNKTAVGLEVCNFTPCDGKVYGYVQSTGRIAVKRLGATHFSDHADGVTVVWTAGPDGGGTAIVGWYTNATVFRDLQHIPSPSRKHRDNNVSEYRIVAEAESAYLISPEKRSFFVPRGKKGGMGQSNVWYADKPERAALVSEVNNYVQSGGHISGLRDVDRDSSAFEGNPKFLTHLRRERDPSLVNRKRRSVFSATGKLCCEVCGFDFKVTYGQEFCEVHHLKPISTMGEGGTTRLADLAVVCSNCHRIIHRIDPMPSIEHFRKLIAGKIDA
jgi:5-methylcytosine-specific restriction protein A